MLQEDPITEEVKVVYHSENDKGTPAVTIESTKFKTPFLVRRSKDNFPFFEVVNNNGTSCGVHGLFTSVEDAKKETLAYIRRSNVSQAVRRDRMTARREKYRATRISEEPDS